jgi:hypothetical protein
VVLPTATAALITVQQVDKGVAMERARSPVTEIVEALLGHFRAHRERLQLFWRTSVTDF